jgi:hypothetical protein
MADDVKATVAADAKSDTRVNLTLTALAATALARYLETHYGIKLSADDALEYVCAGLAGWHILMSGVAPYANRIFDHFFPPQQEQSK